LPYRFEGYAIDTAKRELRRGAELIAVEPQVFDLLDYLVRHRDRVVSKDELMAAVWNGRIVSESALTSRINSARAAIADSGEEQRLIKTLRSKGFRFIGAVTDGGEPPDRTATEPGSALRQEVRFCTASDGVHIAFAAVGSGPPLVRTGTWLTHLEYDWESPVHSPLLHALAQHYRLVRYDSRGTGLSDWDVGDISLEAFVSDLQCVVDAVGLERFPLLGLSQGAAISIAYAVRHPERVSRLILYGGYASGLRCNATPEQIEQADAVLTLIRHGWGQANPAFRQILTMRFTPAATAEQVQWFNELQRRTTSGENAARIRKACDEIDVTALLPQLKVPTLVMHLRDDPAIPFEEGRRIAAAIPGARFVELDGPNHLIMEGDPAWKRFLEEIATFLQS
jgi:pimeloyl-ACP methyl ester carboxylesterase/DNA-binding winged helix-turn-helix (wHTH) protein